MPDTSSNHSRKSTSSVSSKKVTSDIDQDSDYLDPLSGKLADNDLKEVYSEIGLRNKSNDVITDYSHFNRFKIHEDYNPIVSNIAYVFFTIPTLRLDFGTVTPAMQAQRTAEEGSGQQSPISKAITDAAVSAGTSTYNAINDLSGNFLNKVQNSKLVSDLKNRFKSTAEAISNSSVNTSFPYSNIGRSEFFTRVHDTPLGRKIMGCLTHSGDGDTASDGGATNSTAISYNNTGFITLLTNYAHSFSPKDSTLETAEVGETFIGNKLAYGTTKIKADTADTFNVTYSETEDMEITILHKLWVDYINNIRRGLFRTYAKNVHQKRLDYVSSMYYFFLGEDGVSIKFFAKYTGVFPTNVPYSVFDWAPGNQKIRDIDINYQYSFKEEMSPLIIDDFNSAAISLNPNTKKSFITQAIKFQQDPEYYQVHNNWQNRVCAVPDSRGGYKLIFTGAPRHIDSGRSSAGTLNNRDAGVSRATIGGTIADRNITMGDPLKPSQDNLISKART